MNSERFGGLKLTLGDLSFQSPQLSESYRELQGDMQEAYRKLIDWLQQAEEDTDARERQSMLESAIRLTQGYIHSLDLERVEQWLREAESKPSFRMEVADVLPPPRIRIGVCHHNLSNYIDVSLFADLVNSGEVRERLIESGIQVFLHGHKHQNMVATEVIHHEEGERYLHTIAAGTLGALTRPDQTIAVSFNEIKIHCKIEDDSINQRKIDVYTHYCVEGHERHPRWETSKRSIKLIV
jgi:hypothetical protein